MNFPLVSLELRKNRLAAASAAAAFLVTLPVCALVSSTTGLELRLSFDAALTGWIFLGVPLAAALVGASSGAASGSRDALESEALLPASPGRRAAAAIAASILLSSAFALFVVGTGAALGAPPSYAGTPANMAWGAGFWRQLPAAPLLILATLDVLAGAWALSRLIGHGVAGGLLAILLSCAAGAGLAACFGVEMLHNEWGASCWRSAIALAVAGAFGKLQAGVLAARWNERRTGARTLAWALALLALPPLLIGGRLTVELMMLDAKLITIGYEHSIPYIGGADRFPHGSRALAAKNEGAVLKTLRGGIVLVDASGARTLVPEERAGLSDILLRPFKTWIRGHWYDDQGVLWVERHVSPNTELWRIEGSKVESKLMTDYGSFAMVEGVPLKHRYSGAKDVWVATAEDYFRRGDKARWLNGYKGFIAARRREAGAAKVACGGRCLEADGRRWKLPSLGVNGEVIYPHEFGGRRAYFVSVGDGKSSKTVLCRADGSIVVAWPSTKETRSLPDGTKYSFDTKIGEIWMVDPDGNPVLPIDVDVAMPYSVPRLMRRSEGKVWLISPRELTVLDAGGRKVMSKPLPEGIEDAVPLKDGILLTTKRSAWFSDWNGSLRRVQNPR